MATKDQYVTLFEQLIELEDAKKEISLDLKERIETFATNHELHKKAVAKSFKDYKEFLKDEAEYHVVDADALNIMDTILDGDKK